MSMNNRETLLQLTEYLYAVVKSVKSTGIITPSQFQKPYGNYLRLLTIHFDMTQILYISRSIEVTEKKIPRYHDYRSMSRREYMPNMSLL